MQPLKKYLPNILIIVFLAFGVFASVGDANAAQNAVDGDPFNPVSPAEAATGLNPDDVWLTWNAYGATEFWKYSYCIATTTDYNNGACQTGDPNWTGTYNRMYTHLTNLQPNTEYSWRVKVVKCEKKDCTEKSHIISHTNVSTFTTGDDDWLKISGRAGDKAGILVNFYDEDNLVTYSMLTGNKGYYTISVPYEYTGTLYPRLDPESWDPYGDLDTFYDVRFTPPFIHYTDGVLNLTEQNFVLNNAKYISGHTNGVANVPIFFDYGDEGITGDGDLETSYTFMTYSDDDGKYSQQVPKNWYGTVYISEGAKGEAEYGFEGTDWRSPYTDNAITEEEFTPESYAIPQVTTDQKDMDFNLKFVKISGHTDSLEAVPVTFTNGINCTVCGGLDPTIEVESDKDGYYYLYLPLGWQGTISVPSSFDVGDITYYFSPTLYALSPVYNNTYGWSFFKTKIDPSP